jgi:branched-chain amino acid aminotransferase
MSDQPPNRRAAHDSQAGMGEARSAAGGAQLPGFLWVNGDLVPAASASLSVLDHGVTVGDGVFESLKIVRDAAGARHAFALTRHLRRLRRSAAALDLALDRSDDELRAAVRAVLDADEKAAAGRVRITVTGGVSPLGSARGVAAPTVVVAAGTQVPWPPTATVVTVPWRRNEYSALVGVKSTSYAENVVALRHARARGADEAILANTAGQLCEGTGSNVFVGIDGRLVTPPLSAGCLAGVTRELLLELVDADEHDLPLAALGEADEAFLTSSTRDVQAIAAVDGRDLPACPGPLGRAAAEAFAALVARTVDP